MTLQERILSDYTESFKQKQTNRADTLRLVKAALLNVVKELPAGTTALSDEAVTGVLAKEAKRRKDAAAEFQKASRQDLAEKELAELAIIQEYLPAEANDDEIRTVVRAVLAAQPQPSIGVVMGAAMKELKGKADGNRVRAIVQEMLGGK